MLSAQEKKNLISLISRSYWYRFYSIIFAAAGLAIFGYVYFNFIQKDLLTALQNPMTVLTFVVPFLPGAILAYKAERLQVKARDILQEIKHSDQQANASG